MSRNTLSLTIINRYQKYIKSLYRNVAVKYEDSIICEATLLLEVCLDPSSGYGSLTQDA